MYDLYLHYARFRAFMFDCLALIQERWLPPIAVEALVVARRFQSGDAPADELTAERVRCWEHLRERGHTSQLEDDVNRLEDRSSDELALLKRHFPR